MPTVIDPRDEQQRLYVEGMQRGLTGRDLANYAGIPVSQGSSPPVTVPGSTVMPPVSWKSSANYVRETPGSEVDSYWQNFERNFSNAPIADTQKAVQAAMQYLAARNYSKEVASGVDPAIAAMRWAGGMNRGTLSGIASLTRATAAKEPFQFVPGNEATGQPASWQTPSRTARPITISQTSIPKPAQAFGNIVREEITPGSGVYITREEGRPGFKIASVRPQGLTPDQQKKVEIGLMKDISTFQERLQFMNPDDPSYQSTADLIKRMQERVAEIRSEVSAVPRVSSPIAPTPQNPGAPTAIKKRYRWNRQNKGVEEIK